MLLDLIIKFGFRVKAPPLNQNLSPKPLTQKVRKNPPPFLPHNSASFIYRSHSWLYTHLHTIM